MAPKLIDAPAQKGILLHQDDVMADFGGFHRSRHSGDPSTDDKDWLSASDHGAAFPYFRSLVHENSRAGIVRVQT